jgi:rhodanese-related sulfurtransferase
MENSVNINPKEELLAKINFIHEVKIYNEIQNHKKIIIFDLRQRDQYQKAHVQFSINIPFNEYDAQFYINFSEKKYADLTDSEDLKEMIKSYKRYYIVIIMSDEKIKRKNIISFNKQEEGVDKEIIRKSLLLYQSLVTNKVRELGLYNIGFSKFASYYYFLVNRDNVPAISR